MSAARICLALFAIPAWCGLACAQTITVKVDGPHSAARVADVALGEIPPSGAQVQVPAGLDAVPFEVHRGDAVTTGSIARTEPNLWLLAAAIGGAACCVPSVLALGFCAANPGLLAAPVLAAVGIGDLGAITASCVAPSWATVPVLSGCGAAGLSPALLALLADAPPPVVVLPAPPVGAEPAIEVPVAPVVGMAW